MPFSVGEGDWDLINSASASVGFSHPLRRPRQILSRPLQPPNQGIWPLSVGPYQLRRTSQRSVVGTKCTASRTLCHKHTMIFTFPSHGRVSTMPLTQPFAPGSQIYDHSSGQRWPSLFLWRFSRRPCLDWSLAMRSARRRASFKQMTSLTTTTSPTYWWTSLRVCALPDLDCTADVS